MCFVGWSDGIYPRPDHLFVFGFFFLSWFQDPYLPYGQTGLAPKALGECEAWLNIFGIMLN
jgi:hypothetical protein